MKQTQDPCRVGTEGCSAAVLAGGPWGRFGPGKALALREGKPLVEHVTDRLQPLFGRITVIAQDPASYAWLGLDTVADLLPEAGALGGVLTALVHAPGEHCFVVACDMPFLRAPLIRTIVQTRPGCDVVVPVRNGEPQPLHARYARRCIPAIRRWIRRAPCRIIDFYPEVVVEKIPEGVWSRWDPQGVSFSSVNGPEDPARALSREGREGPGR